MDEFEEVIANNKEHAHTRYLLFYKLVQKRDKQMQLLFDGHSRSRAPLQLLAMRGEGLVEKEQLDKLSQELLQATDPDVHNW